MTCRRMLKPIATILAVALAVALPSSAGASSLLSGYGGPGQGNQAILGSALLNGPSGGGGGGGSTGTGGGSAAATGNLAAPASAQVKARPRGASRHSRSSAGRAGQGNGSSVGLSSTGASGKYPLQTALAGSSAGGSGPLGLSGADLMYIILALGVLAVTGAATRQLMRDQDGREGTVAKGMRRRIRGTE
ncbi:MAG: hypothetical protein JWL67_311 [Solirubrobacterales bacterium]|jgi:hypothetical protein|nr:hypothetical protein [Solirubrobacterales bacterium]